MVVVDFVLFIFAAAVFALTGIRLAAWVGGAIRRAGGVWPWVKQAQRLNPTVYAAVVLLTLGVLILRVGFGYLLPVENPTTVLQKLASDLYANGGAELLSIAVTVLIIETLNERRAIAAEKARFNCADG